MFNFHIVITQGPELIRLLPNIDFFGLWFCWGERKVENHPQS